MSSDNQADPLVGTVLGERYEVLAPLNSGGMGKIYRARHVLLDTQLAVKVSHQPRNEEAQRRFLREAKLACKIKHSNIVQIADFGVLPGGGTYLVMELLEGALLTHEIARGPMPVSRVCQIAIQLAQGLQAVHDGGIVHREP